MHEKLGTAAGGYFGRYVMVSTAESSSTREKMVRLQDCVYVHVLVTAVGAFDFDIFWGQIGEQSQSLRTSSTEPKAGLTSGIHTHLDRNKKRSRLKFDAWLIFILHELISTRL